jgi:hypothetical protein
VRTLAVAVVFALEALFALAIVTAIAAGLGIR